MTMTKTLIALAAASICTTAGAFEVDWGQDDLGYSSSGSFVVTPGVTIIGRRQVGVDFASIWNSVTERLAPVPRPPGGDAGEPTQGVPARGPAATPDEKQKRKDQCLTDCSVQFQISNNICIDAVGDMRAAIANHPYWTAIATGIAGGIATRNVAGALLGLPLGWWYSTEINDHAVTTFKAQCDGAAARDWNQCVQGLCQAWFLPVLLLTARRRREDDEPRSM